MNDILYNIQRYLTKEEIEVVFVDSKQMRDINLEHRKIDKSTDVLSFPLLKLKGMPLGSIVINQELAKRRALEFGHRQSDEEALLFIHGLLHLLGYDHEIDNGEMRQKEKELIEKFKLPKSLILRSE
jgi:probable rRNA maturation factor